MVVVLRLLVLLFLVGVSSADLATDRTELLRFYDAVSTGSSNRHLRWNRSSSRGPCDWRGVECSSNTSATGVRVFRLRLPGVGLAGDVPSGSLSSLTTLRVLSLRSNRLSGSFPDLRNCTQLRALYLQNNRFSGELPPNFSYWPQLLRLNLAYNSLNGSIPIAINVLHRLGSLNLENNSLSGSLSSDLDLKLTHFSVANNRLTGPVPGSLRSFPSDSFLGNNLCGPPLAAPCPASAAPSPASAPGAAPRGKKKKNRLSGGAIAGIVLGSVAGAAILLLCCCLIFSSRRRSPQPRIAVRSTYKHQQGGAGGPVVASGADLSSKELEDFSSSTRGDLVPSKLVFFDAGRRSLYDLEDLLRASAEVLGKGSIGTTYKAVLEDGSIVAVKRLKEVMTPKEQFEQHMQIVGSFKHRNIVPLRAYYYSKDEKLLVSDFMTRGSLSALLHGNRGAGRTPLDWNARIRIAFGAAKGLAYMHEHPSGGFVHGSIKSSNILLAKDFEACVSDAGLVHLLNSGSSSSSSANSRMLGYRAPEVVETRRATQKSDVYSYGVLLLELLTGRAPTQAALNDDGIDLPRWVQSVVREEWTAEVFDLELMRYQNIEEDLVQMLQLALSCTSASPEHRPTMQQVVKMVQELGGREELEERQASDPSDERSDTSDSRQF